MNGELLSILDSIERDKGINKEILIQTVESALLTAAKKLHPADEDKITVKIDRQTGQIKVMRDEAELSSGNFGRIAAQTVKQIIIQKIHEAEREVIYSEFISKVGEVVTGSVHRFERGNIVVDLGRAEALLPKEEQPYRDEFRQGDRIKAYLLEVKKANKGPQIIISRTNTNFVKKLFMLEVPEVYEGIVEIKSIAREAGERSKIAVWSKDDKIDCIGACVGMRGSRVKNVVRELQGEKIDIVKWNDDIKEYIAAALSPAQTYEIKIDKEKKSALCLVEGDNLSLAIGRHGQNVRLASKLTGWDIDIKPRADVKAEEAKGLSISKLADVGPKTRAKLTESGFKTIDAIVKLTTEDLMKIKGIGKKTAEKIIEEAKKLYG